MFVMENIPSYSFKLLPFGRCAIDAMQKDCLTENGKSLATPPGEVSLMQLIFGGYLRSKVLVVQPHLQGLKSLLI